MVFCRELRLVEFARFPRSGVGWLGSFADLAWLLLHILDSASSILSPSSGQAQDCSHTEDIGCRGVNRNDTLSFCLYFGPTCWSKLHGQPQSQCGKASLWAQPPENLLSSLGNIHQVLVGNGVQSGWAGKC